MIFLCVDDDAQELNGVGGCTDDDGVTMTKSECCVVVVVVEAIKLQDSTNRNVCII